MPPTTSGSSRCGGWQTVATVPNTDCLCSQVCTRSVPMASSPPTTIAAASPRRTHANGPEGSRAV